jgi:hypothetical protein
MLTRAHADRFRRPGYERVPRWDGERAKALLLSTLWRTRKCWPTSPPSRGYGWALSLSHALTAERGRRGRAGIIVVRLDRLDIDTAGALLGGAWSFATPRAPTRSTAVAKPRGRVANAA